MRGLLAATLTAFKPDGSVNYDIVPEHLNRLIKSGCTGAWVIGTTGEFSTLSVAERKKLAEAWVNAAKQQAPHFGLIVHIGAASIEDSKELARHAESIGAPAIAAIPPVFFKPENVPDLVSTMQDIAAAAPKTPFYYYRIHNAFQTIMAHIFDDFIYDFLTKFESLDIPSRTNVALRMYDFLNAATGVIPNLVGMKYSHYDLMDFADCIRFFEPRYNMLYGHEEYMLGALTHGAEGFVGSTFNLTFMMPHYLQLVHSGSAHEKESNNNLEMPLALKMQERSHDFIGVMFRYGGIPTLKAVVKSQGFDCGDLRLPGRSLPADKVQAALNDIKTLGFDISK